jgi:hypothetical protein
MKKTSIWTKGQVHEEAELENNSKTEKIDPGRQRWTKQPERYKIQEEYRKSANIRGLKMPMHKWKKIMEMYRIYEKPIYDRFINICTLYFCIMNL